MLTRLRHRITFQTVTTVSAGGGCFEETWTDYATRWANVQIKQATEDFQYNKDQQVDRYRIIVRAESFNNKMRVIFENLTLSIESVSDPVQGGRMMEIIARCDQP